jgi:enoyl-CoA hydratase/3-hydroxyacyl-CoA dehydrogenase
MLTRAERLRAPDALAAGLVAELADGPDDLIARACAQVRRLAAGALPRISDAPVALPAFDDSDTATSADGQVLSPSVVACIDGAVRAAAAAPTLAAALDIGYRAFGDVACSRAAREGIDAFLARRIPDFSTSG